VTTRALFGLARPFTLLAPVVGVLAGSAAAAAALGRPWATWRLPLACAAAALVTAASNAWNQVFDLEVDRVNRPGRPLPAGDVRPRTALLLGHGAVLAGLAAAFAVSPVFFGCVAVGVAATWFYSAPPLRLKRRVAGALLAIAVPRGLLVPVAGWAVVAAPEVTDPWALGAVAFLFVLGAAATKDFADVPGDRAHGCVTLPILLGPERAAAVVAPFLVVPFLLYPVFGALGWLRAPLGRLAVLAGVLAVLGLATARALRRDPGGLAHATRGHPAWRGMYLLLLGSQVGVALAYAL